MITRAQLVDVAFTRIVLNDALTPSLRSLRMQNVPDECALTLELRSTSVAHLRAEKRNTCE